VVDEVDLHVPAERVERATAIHFQAAFGGWIGEQVAAHPEQTTAYAAAFARENAARAAGASFLDGLEIEAKLYAPVGQLLDRYDALICPTCGTRGLVAGDDYADHGLEVGGRALEFYFESLLTPVFNVMSRLPVLNVPSGLADNGVPTGVQIAGRSYDDETVFRVGAALERARPWDFAGVVV
jgi:Asp-tRNA(Asn)/Glu-tRNA(Gln) amidotransferase A subunit family amidase